MKSLRVLLSVVTWNTSLAQVIKADHYENSVSSIRSIRNTEQLGDYDHLVEALQSTSFPGSLFFQLPRETRQNREQSPREGTQSL